MKRLNEIEARANAATEGPWEVEPYRDERRKEEGDIDSITGPGPTTIVEQLGCDCCDVGLSVADPDAEFIAHARQDVPALVAALRAVLELHPREGVMSVDPERGLVEDEAVCAECIVNYEPAPWPCPTVAAIRQHLGEGD